MDSKKNVFVIMPFQEEFFEMYEMLKMEFADNYEFTNAGEEGNQQNILRDIIEPIYQSDIVIADLTGLLYDTSPLTAPSILTFKYSIKSANFLKCVE